MKIYILYICLWGSPALFGMVRQEDGVTTKLKLVLIAGRHVYSEHKTIQADAKNRAEGMVRLFNNNEEQLITNQLDSYVGLLTRVMEAYVKYSPDFNPALLEALESSHRCCLKWALSIPSNRKISRHAWTGFRAAWLRMVVHSRSYFSSADTAYDEFVQGKDLSRKLPTESAVEAWCIELPDPVVITSSKLK